MNCRVIGASKDIISALAISASCQAYGTGVLLLGARQQSCTTEIEAPTITRSNSDDVVVILLHSFVYLGNCGPGENCKRLGITGDKGMEYIFL